MKKYLFKISAFILSLFIMVGAAACGQEKTELPKLSTPEVVIGYDGLAVWGKVDYTLYYLYVIDGGEERIAAEYKVQLEDGQTIKVKAVSANDNYDDSDYSQPKTYIKGENQEHDHSDVNSDGFCDICSESVMAELSIYAINDLHGKFIDTDSQPGVDEFTSFMKNLYADNAREEILLSSGDMWQGSVESSTNRGKLFTEWMNDVGFVSMTLGNHEYDWGAQVLKPNSELASFPFLAINVTYNGQPADYCKPSVTVEKNGVKVGIIGAIGNCLSSISGDYTDGLYFATGSALTSLVKEEATRLRNEENCNFIVYSIHDGYENSSSATSVNQVTKSQISDYYDTSLSDGYVDLVFEGHTHQHYILSDEYGVYHLQGGGENNYVSCAEVSFNTVTESYSITPRLLGRSVYASSSIKGDPVVEEIFNKYFPENNPYTTILGTNNYRRNSEEICEKVAELYFNAGKQAWGNEYEITLGGGYLKTRTPYSVAAGQVTYADLFSILPFDNDLVLGTIRGSDLKSRFINADNYNYHCYYTVNANNISDNKYYYIVVDSYTSTYKYNRITEIERLENGKYARDLLADFVSEGGWGTPKNNKKLLNGAYSVYV